MNRVQKEKQFGVRSFVITIFSQLKLLARKDFIEAKPKISL